MYRQLPDIGPFEYVAEQWELCGKYLDTGMGRVPLTWQELRAMGTVLNAHLLPWESEMVMAMSRAYCGYSKSDKDEPPPYSPTDDPREQAIERGHQNEYIRGT